MKKTLSITLGGRIFAIEEDGYAALDAYLQSLRTHFAQDPSVDELIQDIEYSFGEKFSEKLSKDKPAVTLTDVEAVIGVIGRVEEIASEDQTTHDIPHSSETTTATTETATPPKKRLYRNMDDHVIAGVCSGVAAYFGIDPLAIRILAIVLTFANGIGLLIYIVLWIAVPVAETSLQKLEMQGKEPNLNEFQELTKDKPTHAKQDSTLYRILNAPLRLIGFLFEGLKRFFSLFGSIIRIIAGITLLIFAFLFTTLGTMAVLVFSTNINSRYITSDLPLTELARNPVYYVGLGSLYLLALIPLIFLAILGISLLRRKNQFRLATTSTLIGIWILAAGGAAAAGSQIGPWVYTHVQEAENKAVVTRTIKAGAFENVSVSDNLRVTIRQGEPPSITFTGPEEAIARIHTTSSNALLQLTQDAKKREDFRLCFACADQRVTGVITLPTLGSFSGHDTSSARIEGFSNTLSLYISQNADATIEGLGRNGTSTSQEISALVEEGAFLRLNGTADRLRVTLKDNARLDADQLDANHIEVTTEDNAFAEVSPLQSFAATSTQNSFIRSVNAVASSTVVERGNSRIHETESP